MDTHRLITIARDAGIEDIARALEDIQARSAGENVPLTLPLVGEFSAGKTTLINALTDNKQLETATKPTTATIYQLFFGSDRCHATVVGADGSTRDVADISQLKNDELQDAAVVCVYDTSTKVPESTVLVDTPGISSPDENHRRVLMDFLPKADGVLLTVDVNQQITRSLTDFVNDMALAKRRLYLVITKCDTKSPADVAAAKKYIAENCKLPLSQVACVSAANGDVQELLAMLGAIAKDKAHILAEVTEQRIQALTARLSKGIDELLSVPNSDEALTEKISAQKKELDRLNRNIDRLVDDTQESVKDVERDICREFGDTVFGKLDALVAAQSIDFDVQSRAMVNNTAGLYLNEYKNRVQEALYQKAQERRGSADGVDLRSLEELDYSGLHIGEMQYNLNLNALGHEYDGIIAGGAKVLAVAGLVAGTIATAGALGIGVAAGGTAAAGGAVAAGATAAGATAAAAGGTAATTGVAAALAGSADAIAVGAVSVAGGVAQHRRHKRLDALNKQKIQAFMQEAPEQFVDKLGTVNAYNQQIGEQVGAKKGFVEGLVARVTDKTGKPQRQRAIHGYLNDTLIPCFEREMQRVSRELMGVIRTALHTEAQEAVDQKAQTLQDLKAKLEQSRAAYDERMNALRAYKQELIA